MFFLSQKLDHAVKRYIIWMEIIQSSKHDSFNQVLLIKSILSLLQKLTALDENLQKFVYNTSC